MRPLFRFNRQALTSGVLSLLCVAALHGSSDAHLCIVREGLESTGAAEADDRFGGAVAAGDFNGDGYEDLATGAPGENEDISGSYEHGVVIVNWGTRYGITHQSADLITIGAPADNLVRFGNAIASGDFNGDGRDDLAIGAYEADVDFKASVGIVGIAYGQAWGVPANPSLVLDESDAGGLIEAGDRFGYALAVADFDLDGYDDLAVGCYGENSSAGAIYYFRGGPGGITTTGAGAMTQATLGFASTADDWFGWSLAAGDVGGSSHPDLIVGAPRKTVASSSQAGQVYVIRGGASGLTATGATMLNASTLGLAVSAEQFGYSVAVGRFYEKTGPLDLAVGCPRHDAPGAVDAGRVIFVEYDSGAPAGPSPRVFRQNDVGTGATSEDNDQFGFALAAGDWDADGYDDIAMGSPYEDYGSTDGAGCVHLLMGGTGGPGSHGALGYNTTHLNDDPATGDNLGRALCFGRFDDTQRANLAVGAPGKDFAFVYPPDAPAIDKAGSVFVVAPWRQVQSLACWSSISMDCEGSIIFSQKPFDHVRMASTTKAMTLLLASEWSDPSHPKYDAAYTSLNSVYTVPSWVANNIGGSQANLVAQQRISLDGLMKAMMTVSGNDAAYAIADHTTGGGHAWAGFVGTVQDFVDAMNARATQLGMYRTHFTTPKGSNDDEPGFPETPGTQGAHTTAYDFALLSYAVMDNPVARNVVDRTGWMVPSLKWILGQYVPSNDWYANGFYQAWRNRMGDLASGVKPGSTPEALNTGLFAASADSLSFGPAIVTSFRTESGVTMRDQAKELMLLALDECLAPGSIVFPPAEPWEPTRYAILDIPTTPDTCWGGAFEVAAEAPDTLDIDLLGKSLPLGTARATFESSVSWNGVIRPSGRAELSVGPVDSHDGIVLRNDGDTPAYLVLRHTGSPSPVSVVLAPGSTWVVPPFSATGGSDYSLSVENIGGSDAEVTSDLSAWRRATATSVAGSGIAGGPLHFGQHLVQASASSRQMAFAIRGQDRAAGNIVTLTVQDHGRTVTGVELPAAAEIPAPSAGVVSLASAPNPFSPASGSTRFQYLLGAPGRVQLDLYDVEGRLVRRLVNGEVQAAGAHTATWDGRDEGGRASAPGVYFARVEAAGRTMKTRVVVMK